MFWGVVIRKSHMSAIFPPAILGPEMAAPILRAPGFFGSFCPPKFFVLGEVDGGEVPI